MKIEQIYTGCLAQGAYYIVDKGEAAIIDPLREPKPYLDKLAAEGVKLKYIFETHFHADFVSGHVDLRQVTGADIVYGPGAECAFGCIAAQDGQVFKVGDLSIVALHTPGHTLESTTYLLRDAQGKDHCIFSGDTLFLGDVGRPDLAQKAANMTQYELAGLLYDSLYQKILPLSDDLLVYPAHGAGSACGKNMMKETVDTLGNQKKVNYALNQPNKESFVKAVTDGLTTPPGYFGMNVQMNKQGYAAFDQVLTQGLQPLSAAALEQVVEATGALVLDTRTADEFYKGFVPQSINIGLAGDFAPWVGALVVDVQQPIVLVTEPGQESEAITRLSRVGFDKVLGFLEGGFATWMQAGKPVDTIDRISVTDFAQQYQPNEDLVIDVRRAAEHAVEKLPSAQNKPLDLINEWVANIDPSTHFFLHCAGGYRSMIAASILQARGYRNFTEIAGGMNALVATGLSMNINACSLVKN
ncbi:MAG: MBL fold metallo-hydrolase [Sphingobacteriia bacterium]|nr:MAG: MBL fold metallo-hydrolase [Sphingobacteriia bacterium]